MAKDNIIQSGDLRSEKALFGYSIVPCICVIYGTIHNPVMYVHTLLFDYDELGFEL